MSEQRVAAGGSSRPAGPRPIDGGALAALVLYAAVVAVVTWPLLPLAFAEWRERMGTRFGRPGPLLLALAIVALLFFVPTGPTHILARHAPLSYPIQPAPPSSSAVIDMLGRGSGTVLELPTGTPARDAPALYRSIFHHRPLVNGYGSYFPASHARMLELAARLPTPTALQQLRAEAGVTTIVVRAKELDAATRRAWDLVLREGAPLPGFDLVTSADDEFVFATTAPGPP